MTAFFETVYPQQDIPLECLAGNTSLCTGFEGASDGTDECLASTESEHTCEEGFTATHTAFNATYAYEQGYYTGDDLREMYTCVPDSCFTPFTVIPDSPRSVNLRSGRTWLVAPLDGWSDPSFFDCVQTDELQAGEYLATYELVERFESEIIQSTEISPFTTIYGGYVITE